MEKNKHNKKQDGHQKWKINKLPPCAIIGNHIKLQAKKTSIHSIDRRHHMYDKAWLDAIVYLLQNEVIRDPEWDLIKRMNKYLFTQHNKCITYLSGNKLEASKEKPLHEKLAKSEASTIFKARKRMLSVKDNFRNKQQTQICKARGMQTKDQPYKMRNPAS